MSSTRYNNTGEFSPEAMQASSKLRGIAIGMNIIIRVARSHPDATRRAIIWLANYANMRGLTADALTHEVDLPKGAIRAALTDPDCEDIDIFRSKVEALRARFEATLPTLVETKVKHEVDRAMRCAARKTKMVEIIGKTRMGKSDCARQFWLRNLDRCLWFECPEDSTTRGFFYTLADRLGIGISTAKKTGLLREQCRACFGPGGVEILIVDEAHRLWPADVRCKPERIEFLRAAYADGTGTSVVIIGTPQHTESLNGSLESAGRWSPGQYLGRIVPYHLDDTMSITDLAAIAAHYAPGASKAVIDALVEGALISEGYCGQMVNVIELAQDDYLEPGQPLTLDAVSDAQLQMSRAARLQRISNPAPRTRRKAA